MQLGIRLAAGLLAVSLAGAAAAQVAMFQGIGSAPLSGHGLFGKRKLTALDRQQALASAEANAIDYYFANQGRSAAGNYASAKAAIDANLAQYVLSYVLLDEHTDMASGDYTVTVRASLDIPALERTVNSNSATAATPAANRSYVMFVFVARQIAAIRTFDPDREQHVDVTQSTAAEASHAASQDAASKSSGDEGQAISANNVEVTDSKSADTQLHASTSANANLQNSMTIDSGGSTESKSATTLWRIFPSENLDSALTGEFTSDGYNPVSEAFVEPSTNGILRIQEIRADYSTGDDLTPTTLQHVVAGAKAAQISFVALGTMDVDQTQVNPATGLPRVGVTVNARVLDVTGRLPRQIASVGPLQYFGNGPNENSAQTNALSEAGGAVARKLSSQMQAAGFH